MNKHLTSQSIAETLDILDIYLFEMGICATERGLIIEKIDELVKQKCKEQRDICANEIKYESLTGLEAAIEEVTRRIVRNAPEPK